MQRADVNQSNPHSFRTSVFVFYFCTLWVYLFGEKSCLGISVPLGLAPGVTGG